MATHKGIKAIDKILPGVNGKPDSFGRILFEVRQVWAALAIDETMVDRELADDYTIIATYQAHFKQLILNVSRCVLSQTMDRIEIPCTWLDHFKLTSRYCPKWVKKKWPAKVKVMECVAYYPKLYVKNAAVINWESVIDEKAVDTLSKI